jgi:hypothetical protein
MHYLAELLASPERDFHVHALVGDDAGPSDAGEVLDARARREYKQRLEELREALGEAEARNDAGRAERLRAELDAVVEALAAAVGLGGRARRTGSSVERARVNVQRRVRDAIARIGECEPALGRYLASTVRTGVFCRFAPIDAEGA